MVVTPMGGVTMTLHQERRGFASMDKALQREIARKGGKAAHAKGTAHQWTKDEAREAGKLGGAASRGGRGKLPSGPAQPR